MTNFFLSSLTVQIVTDLMTNSSSSFHRYTMFSGLWEAAKNSPFQRVGEAHCDAPQKQLVAGRTISAASTGKEEEEGKAEVDNRLMGRQTEIG